MNEHDKPATLNRRRFFSRIGTFLSAAGAAVFLRSRQQTPAADKTHQTEPAPKRGYHVTEHVRKYYHKARF